MSKRILVVEDSPSQAALVTHDLQTAGYEVAVATDGEQALGCLAGQSFDLVLSDVVMPGMDGYELCRRTKQRRPDQPVILLTSLDDPIEIVHGLEAGADNFLRKPYERDALLSRISTTLEQRAQRSVGNTAREVEVMLRDRRVPITAERQQILDLLMTSFEDLVRSNKELHEREVALLAAEGRLRVQLAATERERRRLASVLGAAPHAIVLADRNGTVTDVSDNLCALLGRDRSTVLRQPLEELLRFVDASGRTLPLVEQPFTETLSSGATAEAGANFDLFLQRDETAVVPVMVRCAPIHDESDTTVAVVAAVHEIGALFAHDRVTRLPHQALFADRVAGAVTAAASSGRWVAVLAVVFDHFARWCENLSSAETDALLATFADRLRRSVGRHRIGPDAGSAAYFGHDTFAVVLSGLDDELHGVHQAGVIAEDLSAELLRVAGHALPVSVTVGVAVDDGSTTDPISLVASAVGAARRVAAGGGGRIEIADPAIDARAGDWLRRQAELRTAINEDQLVVHYHPEIDLRNERGWGVEALVRWQHPERGLLPPSEFLPLAQDTGLVAPLGWWVLREACRQAAQWHAVEPPGVAPRTLSVNIDASQLADPAVAQRVATILHDTGLDPAALILEVTEHGVMHDAALAAARLRDLKALGIRLAIDDFGTGYSSLAQLRNFPVDFLKIDRGFVNGMINEADDATIVEATIRLANALGIEAVAEGVEREDQLERLGQLGCDFGQGFHWTRPLPPRELERWWRTSAALPGPTVER